MNDSTFVSSYGGTAGSGGVAVLSPLPMPIRQQAQILTSSVPQLSFQSETLPLHLSTYTSGEDFGRLAFLPKEFGLARIRTQKNQIRKKIPKLEVIHNDQQQNPNNLRYHFSGYSIWLELEQQVDINGLGDLERAVKEAAIEFDLGGAIPFPHVTALYGIMTLADDEEARSIFREEVVVAISRRAEKQKQEGAGKIWPDLVATGIFVGKEIDGVNGGLMDMAWAEISFASTPEHEALIDDLYNIFYRRDATRQAVITSVTEEKKQNWAPHLSICYDNPEGFGSILTRQSFHDFLKSKCPTLAVAADSSEETVKFTRAVSGISLWKTFGVMADWKCLDRFEFVCLTRT